MISDCDDLPFIPSHNLSPARSPHTVTHLHLSYRHHHPANWKGLSGGRLIFNVFICNSCLQRRSPLFMGKTFIKCEATSKQDKQENENIVWIIFLGRMTWTTRNVFMVRFGLSVVGLSVVLIVIMLWLCGWPLSGIRSNVKWKMMQSWIWWFASANKDFKFAAHLCHYSRKFIAAPWN